MFTTTLKKLLITGAIAAPLALTLGLASTGDAQAKITPTSYCENGGGQRPAGQQPNCKGGGLDQETANTNPQGKLPGGHNK
jgi:hypothetical protein